MVCMLLPAVASVCECKAPKAPMHHPLALAWLDGMHAWPAAAAAAAVGQRQRQSPHAALQPLGGRCNGSQRPRR
jgi:hypothetical protein